MLDAYFSETTFAWNALPGNMQMLSENPEYNGMSRIAICLRQYLSMQMPLDGGFKE